MSDKIVFLDIDGPMIPYRCLVMPGQTGIMTIFDPVAVSLLNHLCEEHGWKIVLHTSWVRIMGGEETFKHCVQQGIKAQHFHSDAFCDENIHWRYTRVAKWLEQHPEVTQYAMLDDEPYQFDMDGGAKHPEGMSKHLVLINYYRGFMYEDLMEVLAVGRGAEPRMALVALKPDLNGEQPMYSLVTDQ